MQYPSTEKISKWHNWNADSNGPMKCRAENAGDQRAHEPMKKWTYGFYILLATVIKVVRVLCPTEPGELAFSGGLALFFLISCEWTNQITSQVLSIEQPRFQIPSKKSAGRISSVEPVKFFAMQQGSVDRNYKGVLCFFSVAMVANVWL